MSIARTVTVTVTIRTAPCRTHTRIGIHAHSLAFALPVAPGHSPPPTYRYLQVWLLYSFATNATVDLQVVFVNKQPTRLPEATFVRFNPAGNTGASGQWSQSVLGQWADPNDVAAGGAHGLHYVDDEGVRFSPSASSSSSSALSSSGKTPPSLQVRAIDAGLLRWSQPLPFPTPLTTLSAADLAVGPAFCVHNNIWNTNYPFYFPFDGDNDASLAVRFQLRLGV